MSSTIIMPQLGETVAEGKILTWFKKTGDDVKIGDKLFEVETDKVTVEIEATTAGKLTEIRVGDGVTAKVGAVVAVIGGDALAIVAATVAMNVAMATTTAPFRSAFEEVATPIAHYGPAKGAGDIRMTPLARRLLAERGLDRAAVEKHAAAKGLRKIEEKDVSSFTPSSAAPAAIASSSDQVITLNTIRTRTGERLAENWRNIPHVFQAIDVDFTEIELVRARHKERFKADTGYSLTYLPFIARAVCIALQAFPHVNARFDGKSLILSSNINLGIAVDLNHNGLVVPVVHAVQDYTLQGLAKAMNRQIDKARTGKMTAADMSGGTYSITNNGAFGTSFTTPIINAPQVAILSTDAIRKKPAVITTELGDAIVPRLIGTVGQSFDHRAFDGAYAAAYLSKLKETLETKKWAGELGENA
jgi:pyruvate/2-oxoglutarate dehydrogenase complex dihydrolipoamide acyltransferase (E2) component